MTTDSEYPKTEEWVAIGPRADRKGKEYTLFHALNPDGTLDDKPLAYSWKANVGGVYKVQTNDDRSGSKRPQFVRPWDDRAQVAEWELRARAERTDMARRAAERRHKAQDPILECLEPLREAYAKAPYYQKRVMELLVLDYLRRPLA